MILKLATETEAIHRDRLTYEAWGGGLTQDQFLDREIRLRSHTWCKKGMQSWLLLEGSTILASCESFEMGDFFGFASVFTEPGLRKKGHASSLLSQVIQQLSSRAKGFLLFSEVGADIYARLGFQVVESNEVLYEPVKEDFSSPRIVKMSQADFLEQYQKPSWMVAPSSDQYGWHFERENVYHQLLQAKVKPSFHALKSPTGNSVWMMDYKHQIFRALSFTERDISHAREMLNIARFEAHRVGARSISVYETLSNTKVLTGNRQRRSDALAMIRGPLTSEIHRVHWI